MYNILVVIYPKIKYPKTKGVKAKRYPIETAIVLNIPSIFKLRSIDFTIPLI
jgi:hypothetical protein